MKKLYSAVILVMLLIFLPLSARALEEDEKSEKVVYLTFDDGPSYIVTPRILDILKEKNIKATFFVVGNKIQYRENILERIKEEGHAIGLHTYTHKYKLIYSSNDSFIKEMEDTAEEVNRVLGYRPFAIRFPTGSKPHLNEKLLERLHEKNYKIYDWNASLSDGINYNTPTVKLVREAAKIVGRNNNKIFLLLHCDQANKNTAKALPTIIDYYRDLGYEFKIIDENTPEYYFRFKKS